MDSFSLPEGMTFDIDELEAVPTEGAIVKLRFPKTRQEEPKKKPKKE